MPLEEIRQILEGMRQDNASAVAAMRKDNLDTLAQFKDETGKIEIMILGDGTKERPGFSSRLVKVEDFQGNQIKIFWLSIAALIAAGATMVKGWFTKGHQ